MRKAKKLLLILAVLALVFVTLVACEKPRNDDYAAIPKPIVVQDAENELYFRWEALDGVDGYAVNINGNEFGIGNPVYTRLDENGNTIKECKYVVDTTDMSAGQYGIRFAAYIYHEEGNQLGDWGQMFTFVVGNAGDIYATLGAPVVSQSEENKYMFSWAPVEGAYGYVVKINGREMGIGNSLTDISETSVFMYSVDTTLLNQGNNTIQFAAYSYDPVEGSKVGNWSVQFTIYVGATQDIYEILSAPVVSQSGENKYMFSWAPVEGAHGYVVKLNGKEIGIGNPIAGGLCSYSVDTTILAEGDNTIQFAAYSYDVEHGSTLGNWSEEFTFFHGTIDNIYDVIPAPMVIQGDEDCTQFLLSKVDFTYGYVMELDGVVHGIAPWQSAGLGYYSYTVNAENLEFGEHTVRFAAYIYDPTKGVTIGEWSNVFSVIAGEAENPYLPVTTLGIPQVIQRTDAQTTLTYLNYFVWAPVQDAYGYIVSVDGELIGLDKFTTNYLVDISAMEAGIHTVKVAAYKYDVLNGVEQGEWTQEFEIELAPVPQIDLTVFGNGRGVIVNIAQNYATVSQLNFDFGNDITATYKFGEDGHPAAQYAQSINFADMEFSAELVDGEAYIVQFTAINNYGESEISLPHSFKYTTTSYVVNAPIAIAVSTVAEAVKNNCAYNAITAEVRFYFETELSVQGNPMTLKVNEKEYLIKFTGAGVSHRNMNYVTLSALLDCLREEERIEILQTILFCDEVNVALKLNFEEGFDVASEYSEECGIWSNLEERPSFEAKLAQEVLKFAPVSELNVSGDLLPKRLAYDYSAIPEYVYDKLSYQIAVVDALGQTHVLDAVGDKLNGKVFTYDNPLPETFGEIKLMQTVTFTDGETELTFLLRSESYQIENVTVITALVRDKICWAYSAYLHPDAFIVEVMGNNGNDIFEVDYATAAANNFTWSTFEYLAGNVFEVKVYPVLGGVSGRASQSFKVTREEIPDWVVSSRNEDIFINQNSSPAQADFNVAVNLPDYDTSVLISQSALLDNGIATYIAGNNISINKIALVNAIKAICSVDAVQPHVEMEIVLSVNLMGNNHQYADSLPRHFALSFQYLSYSVIDSQFIKFNQFTDVSANNEYISWNYYNDDGAFDVVSWFDENCAPYGISKLTLNRYNDSLSGGFGDNLPVNTVYLPLVFENFYEARVSAPVRAADSAGTHVSVYCPDVQHHALYDWFINNQSTGEQVFDKISFDSGLNLADLNLDDGIYEIYVRVKGNDLKFSSPYTKFVYAKLTDASLSDLKLAINPAMHCSTITLPIYFGETAILNINGWCNYYSERFTQYDYDEFGFEVTTTQNRLVLSPAHEECVYSAVLDFSFASLNPDYTCIQPLTLNTLYVHAIDMADGSRDIYYSYNDTIAEELVPQYLFTNNMLLFRQEMQVRDDMVFVYPLKYDENYDDVAFTLHTNGIMHTVEVPDEYNPDEVFPSRVDMPVRIGIIPLNITTEEVKVISYKYQVAREYFDTYFEIPDGFTYFLDEDCTWELGSNRMLVDLEYMGRFDLYIGELPIASVNEAEGGLYLSSDGKISLLLNSNRSILTYTMFDDYGNKITDDLFVTQVENGYEAVNLAHCRKVNFVLYDDYQTMSVTFDNISQRAYSGTTYSATLQQDTEVEEGAIYRIGDVYNGGAGALLVLNEEKTLLTYTKYTGAGIAPFGVSTLKVSWNGYCYIAKNIGRGKYVNFNLEDGKLFILEDNISSYQYEFATLVEPETVTNGLYYFSPIGDTDCQIAVSSDWTHLTYKLYSSSDEGAIATYNIAITDLGDSFLAKNIGRGVKLVFERQGDELLITEDNISNMAHKDEYDSAYDRTYMAALSEEYTYISPLWNVGGNSARAILTWSANRENLMYTYHTTDTDIYSFNVEYKYGKFVATSSGDLSLTFTLNGNNSLTVSNDDVSGRAYTYGYSYTATVSEEKTYEVPSWDMGHYKMGTLQLSDDKTSLYYTLHSDTSDEQYTLTVFNYSEIYVATDTIGHRVVFTIAADESCLYVTEDNLFGDSYTAMNDGSNVYSTPRTNLYHNAYATVTISKNGMSLTYTVHGDCGDTTYRMQIYMTDYNRLVATYGGYQLVFTIATDGNSITVVDDNISNKANSYNGTSYVAYKSM